MQLSRVIIGLAVTHLAAAAQIPTLEGFHVAQVFRGPAAKPVLHTQVQKRFATEIRKQAVAPPNFAGHYKIVEFDCGTSCVSMVVADLATGNVYDGPFIILGYGSNCEYEGGFNELEYRASSRLLVARGCPEDVDKDCGTYYFEWQGDHFAKLRFAPHGPLIPSRKPGHLLGLIAFKLAQPVGEGFHLQVDGAKRRGDSAVAGLGRGRPLVELGQKPGFNQLAPLVDVGFEGGH
jgi:hypothetical protein